MQIQPTHKQSTPNFTALKKIKCSKSGYTCNSEEQRVIKELKDLAKVDKFFKDNDVNAQVTVKRYSGTKVKLETKPATKNFRDRIKNLFIEPKTYLLKDTHWCPLDSSFFVAKKLRNIKNNIEEFSKTFTKV